LKVFDLLVLLALLITAYSGFKNGFIQTIFKTIGYIAGGVAGVAVAVEVMNSWSSNLAKAVGAMILILLLATAGEFILGKVGLGLRKVLFISPLKLLDSLLGALLALLRTVAIFYLFCIILMTSQTSFADNSISNSSFYTLTDSLLAEASNKFFNLRFSNTSIFGDQK